MDMEMMMSNLDTARIHDVRLLDGSGHEKSNYLFVCVWIKCEVKISRKT
jgi:hypothetical protein